MIKIELNQTGVVGNANFKTLKNDKEKEENISKPIQEQTSFSKEYSSAIGAMAAPLLKSGKPQEEIASRNKTIIDSIIDNDANKTYETYVAPDGTVYDSKKAVKISFPEDIGGKIFNHSIVQSFREDGSIERIYDELASSLDDYDENGVLRESRTLFDNGANVFGVKFDKEGNKISTYQKTDDGRYKETLNKGDYTITRTGIALEHHETDPLKMTFGINDEYFGAEATNNLKGKTVYVSADSSYVAIRSGKINTTFVLMDREDTCSGLGKRKMMLKSSMLYPTSRGKTDLVIRKIVINEDGEIEKATKEVLDNEPFGSEMRTYPLYREEVEKMTQDMEEAFEVLKKSGFSKTDFKYKNAKMSLDEAMACFDVIKEQVKEED